MRPAQDEPDHGVRVVFIDLPNTKIELLTPLGEGSPIAGFLEKNPSGGIHHICYEVEDIIAARDQLKASGARVLGTFVIWAVLYGVITSKIITIDNMDVFGIMSHVPPAGG